jgi:hypothetical protein
MCAIPGSSLSVAGLRQAILFTRPEMTADYLRSFATILISVMPLDGINRET